MDLPQCMLTLIDTASETVKQSLTSFVENQLKSNPEMLSGALVSEVNLGLQESLDRAGRQALKAFIEQFDCPESEIERGGRTYRIKDEASDKQFLTLFGEVEITRRYYHCRQGGAGIVPLDEAWEMQGRYATPEVVESLLWGSALLVPKELEQFCVRMGRFEPSASCIQDIISGDGAGMAEMLEREHSTLACRQIEVPEQTEVMVASLDGVNVLLREKGVRRGRPAQRPGRESHGEHLKDVESASSYKNAMVGSFSFYTRVDSVVDIESGLEGLVPQRLSSIYCARMPEDRATGFKEEFESLAEDITAKLVDEEVTKILVIDGARPLWNYVEGHRLFGDFRLLLDFFHASEHLSRAAEALFGKESDEAKSWYDKWRFQLKYEEGGAVGLLRSIAYYGKTRTIPKSRRKDLEREVVFFKRNKARMNYHEHAAHGWPIGSGPVEAACKTIVKARLCQSGMRWNRQGGRSVLALRVLYKSRQWDQAWKHYCSNHWQKAA